MIEAMMLWLWGAGMLQWVLDWLVVLLILVGLAAIAVGWWIRSHCWKFMKDRKE